MISSILASFRNPCLRWPRDGLPVGPPSLSSGPFLHVVKKEPIAITLLFFSALGLLPAWASLLFAAYGISRLAVVLYQANASLADLQDVGVRLERLTAQSQGLERERNAAVVGREDADQARARAERALGILQLEHVRQTDLLGAAQRHNEDLARRLTVIESSCATVQRENDRLYRRAQGEELWRERMNQDWTD